MKIRIYYEDTDCGGVVYHSNYLKFMERSRTEFLREHGIEFAGFHKEGTVLAITEAQLKYRHAAVYDDLLTLESYITEVTSFRIGFRTDIYNQHGKLCCRGDVKMVAVDTESSSVTRINDEIIEKVKIIFENKIKG